MLSAIAEKNIQLAWNLNMKGLFNILDLAKEKHVPKFTHGSSERKRNKPAWMSETVILKLKEKQRTFKAYMRSKKSEDYKTYAKARNQAKWACRKAVRDYERVIALESKKNPQAFFRYARSKLKVKTGVSDLQNKDGITFVPSLKYTLDLFYISPFYHIEVNH